MVAGRGSEAAPMNQTSMELQGDREIVISRTFNGPARIVFDAWTKPELVRRWWAPKSRRVSIVSCDADVRVGGGYRYVLRRDTGERVRVLRQVHGGHAPLPPRLHADLRAVPGRGDRHGHLRGARRQDTPAWRMSCIPRRKCARRPWPRAWSMACARRWTSSTSSWRRWASSPQRTWNGRRKGGPGGGVDSPASRSNRRSKRLPGAVLERRARRAPRSGPASRARSGRNAQRVSASRHRRPRPATRSPRSSSTQTQRCSSAWSSGSGRRSDERHRRRSRADRRASVAGARRLRGPAGPHGSGARTAVPAERPRRPAIAASTAQPIARGPRRSGGPRRSPGATPRFTRPGWKNSVSRVRPGSHRPSSDLDERERDLAPPSASSSRTCRVESRAAMGREKWT